MATVEQSKRAESRPRASIEELWTLIADPKLLRVTEQLVDGWHMTGHRLRLGPTYVARGERPGGERGLALVAVYADGRVLVPFKAYAGCGIEIGDLTIDTLRAEADALLGFQGSERQARTAPGWFRAETLPALQAFGSRVSAAYADANTKPASA